MFAYETEEVKELISETVGPILWFMFKELDSPSSNHHFELSIIEMDGQIKQRIIHTQRNTSYRREFSYKFPVPITVSVYIVGFSTDKWLMLLQP